MLTADRLTNQSYVTGYHDAALDALEAMEMHRMIVATTGPIEAVEAADALLRTARETLLHGYTA